MVTVNTVDGMENVSAQKVELQNEWVIAFVTHTKRNNHRYIPKENVQQIIENAGEASVEIVPGVEG